MHPHDPRTAHVLVALSLITLLIVLVTLGPVFAVVFIAGWTLGWIA